DWYEVPNLWGCIVGRPGVLKSPAMEQALKPLQRLEAQAREAYDLNLKDHKLQTEVYELRKQESKNRAKAAIKEGLPDVEKLLNSDEPDAPTQKRYIVNDTTYEKLGAILCDNPNGVLAFRDELISLLKHLDHEENTSARGFYLTGWNGLSGYSF